MKQRNISGIYFKYQNPETGKWENWCFEDMPKEDQEKQLEGRSKEWLVSMVFSLSKTLKNVCDSCDVVAGE